MNNVLNNAKSLFKRLLKRSEEMPPADPAASPLQVLTPEGIDPGVTAPLPELPAEFLAPKGSELGRPKVWVSYAQSVGVVRDHNEDALLTLSNSFEGDEDMPRFGLFVVADGMGGHSMGERASAITSRVVAQFIINKVYLPLLSEPNSIGSLPPLQEIVHESISRANETVAQEVPQGGTTATVGLVVKNRLIIGHVGDSRAYLYNESADNKLSLLTRDHSLVQRLQELGQLTAEEAAIHPQRNVLYRAVGQGEGLEIDVHNYQVQSNTKLLICSDGLWGLIDDPDILAIMATASSSQVACERMVAAANEAGGPDNITAIVVDFH